MVFLGRRSFFVSGKPKRPTGNIEGRHKTADKRGRGRPRAFDRQTAIDRAMILFWERGYEGTSFNALTEVMGLSASSLQNSFGSKEALFREAMRHYSEGPSAWYAAALAAPVTAREAFEMLITEIAANFTRSDLPVGCMVSITATQTAPDLSPIREFATEARQSSQKALADRLRRGIAEGDVPADTDVDALAAYFGTVFRGMAVQARDGASRTELATIGAYAMRIWPVPDGVATRGREAWRGARHPGQEPPEHGNVQAPAAQAPKKRARPLRVTIADSQRRRR
jgi:AcrR family transcriptional regulator